MKKTIRIIRTKSEETTVEVDWPFYFHNESDYDGPQTAEVAGVINDEGIFMVTKRTNHGEVSFEYSKIDRTHPDALQGYERWLATRIQYDNLMRESVAFYNSFP